MRHLALTLILLSASSPGCSSPHGPESAGIVEADGHFACAALIGVADRLVASARLARDEKMARDGLNAAMTHMNAWAVAKRLPEREAFEKVKVERDRLISLHPAAEIAKRARACIDRLK